MKSKYNYGFILTKWYVKVKMVSFKESFMKSFILTKWYVKPYWDIVKFSGNVYGFILTKWYVKTDIISK
ncbi:hypothetical protein KWU67_18665 [Clostridioides difficile]|nr:hypothetical protein [Clostridioides difficile]MDO0309968.1 hypothetical protein [Clostridioides difficile]